MNCGRDVATDKYVKIGTRSLILTPNTKLYIDNDNLADALVVSNPQDKSMLLIQNISNQKWTAETPSGKVKEVEPKGFMPVKAGIKISFSNVSKGEIIA